MASKSSLFIPQTVVVVNTTGNGNASLEKRHLLQTIVTAAGRLPWRVRRHDEVPRYVLPSLTFVAFKLLAKRADSAVLVVERPSEVLHTLSSSWLRALFGIEAPEEDSLPFDENLLATNAVPAVWLGSDIANLPDDTIARFIFHAPLKKAERSAHEQAVKLRLKKLRLGKLATAKILALDGVSSAQIESAAKAARLAGSTMKSARDQALIQALVRSQRALSRDLADRTRPPVTQYSLEYLNTSGRFSPQQILASLRRRPKGSLLLYGPPGTGKTQFTEHLAGELKLPLVSKSASVECKVKSTAPRTQALSANSLPPG